MRLKLLRVGVLAALLSLAYPASAHAGPVVVAFATWVTTSLPFISAAVDTFVFYAVQTAVYVAASTVLTKLTTPRNRASAQERAASVAQLQIGEGPRELVLGEAATAGRLLDAGNYGGEYGTDWEFLVVAVADHYCQGLTGFYVGDAYYDFAGDGVQPGFNNQLELYFYNGALDQAASGPLVACSGGRWTANDRLAGMAYVVARYKADDPHSNAPIWSTGRPVFLFKVKGARAYDPRKDSTVTGGSGAHRWEDPATWEWTDNAAVCRYAYNRGIYAGDQVTAPTALMIGRGLSEVEAPPERMIAAANLCDELVALKAGGSERRYRVNGVIRSDEPFINVEEMFAAAMAGTIVQRDGGVEVEPGAAKSAVVNLVDGDLLAGLQVRVETFVSANDRVNTVTPRYIEPTQMWRDTAAPVRHSTADLIADGGLAEKSLSLSLVTSQTQAQRCGEIERRLARKERRASLVLGPRFSYLETGDWITWTSDRYLQGATDTFRVEAVSVGEDYKTTLILREIGASVYAWNPAVDEGVPGQAPVDEAGSGDLDPLELAGVVIQSFALTGDDLSILPAVKASWTVPVDVAIAGVRLEIRRDAGSEVTPTTMADPNLGAMITTNGVPSLTGIQGRVIPVSNEGRRVTPSDWFDITTDGLTTADVVVAINDGALTPGEKLYVVPFFRGIISNRDGLRARADALNLLTSNNLERLHFENAATAFDADLAGLTSPVAWDDSSGLTEIGDPVALRNHLEAAIATADALEWQILAVFDTTIGDVADQVADLMSAAGDGVLSVAEKKQNFIWGINQLTFAQANLRANADAFKFTVALGDAERIAFENAATALSTALAALTTPVPWNNYSDVTTVADPNGLATAIDNLAKAEKALQLKISGTGQGTLVGAGGQLLTYADIQNALYKAPAKNLWRKVDWAAAGTNSAATASPGFGQAGWGYTLGSVAAGQQATVVSTRSGFGNAEPYSPSFRAKLTTGAGTATVRCGWRAYPSGAAIADVPDVLFTVSTTEQRFAVDGVKSANAAFPSARFYIFAVSGDVAAGKVVTVADLMMEHATAASLDWRPSPDDPELLRYATYVGSLDADKTSVNTAAGIAGQGSLATSNSANWSSQVGGSGKPQDYADITASHTAAGISGQGTQATANAAYSGSDPGGPDGSWWADAGSHTLKFRYGGSWVAVANLGGSISATASPSSVAGSHFGAAVISTGFTTCFPSGGTSYTYQWVFLSGDTCTIGSPNSASTNFSRFCNLGEDFSGVARCYVTDASGAVAYADVAWSVSETH